MAVLIVIYFSIIYAIFRLGQFRERTKMWSVLGNGYVSKCDDPVATTTYIQLQKQIQIPRKYRQ